MKVDSESGPISLQQWAGDGLGTFPFRVTGAMIALDCEDPGAAAVEIDSDCEDGVVLRISGDAPVDALTGVLLIGLPSGDPGALRPVLSASLIDSISENT